MRTKKFTNRIGRRNGRRRFTYEDLLSLVVRRFDAETIDPNDHPVLRQDQHDFNVGTAEMALEEFFGKIDEQTD